MDKRYQILKERLSSLSRDELLRIKKDIDMICFDTYNYDSDTQKFCPLAVAMNLHLSVYKPTDEFIKRLLATRFDPVNAIGGVEGNFYTGEHRKEDLLQVVDELL